MPITEWNPGAEYHADEPDLLPIAEPPCKDCAHWKPIREWENVGARYEKVVMRFKGVILCQGHQRRDFSCFKSKVAQAEPM